jgi:uncharacterized protein YndB with AHSA1/START domain
MAITAHVYQIYIAADADQVWAAITDSDWTERYFHTTRFVEPPVAGQRYRTVITGGGDAVEGMVEELTPPGAGTPGRLVQTWHVLYDAALAAEPPGRVEWTVEQVGDRLTRVRLVHGDLAGSPLTWAHVKDGWVWILDGMKTLLETGRALPSPMDDVTSAPATTDADWHRRQGVEANNSAGELLDAHRSVDDDEELLRLAYAAAYHWEHAASATPANQARADYLVAKALLATGQPERALVSADRCLARCERDRLADFDLAYAHEARARALRALGREDEAAQAWAMATAVEVADPEDREIVEKDFADY